MDHPDVGFEALRRWCYAVPGAAIAAGGSLDWRPLSDRATAAAAVDAEATLAWIIAAFRTRRDSATADWQANDLPHAKAMAVDVITSGKGATLMSDAGLLVDRDGMNKPLATNALWYAVLELLAAELKITGDPQGDHFERLAGRFRRSFARWNLNDPAHAPGTTLLLITLPYSPVARTKQRQVAAGGQEIATDNALLQTWRIEANAVIAKPAEAATIVAPLGSDPFPKPLTADEAIELLGQLQATPEQLARAEISRVLKRFAAK
jgi:hypothetical protein